MEDHPVRPAGATSCPARNSPAQDHHGHQSVPLDPYLYGHRACPHARPRSPPSPALLQQRQPAQEEQEQGRQQYLPHPVRPLRQQQRRLAPSPSCATCARRRPFSCRVPHGRRRGRGALRSTRRRALVWSMPREMRCAYARRHGPGLWISWLACWARTRRGRKRIRRRMSMSASWRGCRWHRPRSWVCRWCIGVHTGSRDDMGRGRRVRRMHVRIASSPTPYNGSLQVEKVPPAPDVIQPPASTSSST